MVRRRSNTIEIDMKELQMRFTSGRPEHLFVVRLWRERVAETHGQWRGSVAHVSTGQMFYFANLGDLTEFITLRLDRREETR